MSTSSGRHRAHGGLLARRGHPARGLLVVLTALAALATACGGDDPVRPPAEAPCDGVTQPVLSLARYEARILDAEAAHCTVLAGAGAEYLVMPQLTGEALPYGGYGYRIGDPSAAPIIASALAHDAAAGGSGARPAVPAPGVADLGDAQERLDAGLRQREAAMPARARPLARAPSDRPAAFDTLRTFSVLNTLAATPTFAPVHARLAFAGAQVLLYVDTVASASLSAGELASMGALYDTLLTPAALGAFGPTSDLDANGRLVFLITPVVNALVTAQECATSGFVRGFFYGHDLASDAVTSNRGEIIYGYVPDPGGRWSCAHTAASVEANLPPTFIHELQHLISYGAHVVARGGASEVPWLNEGLSHVAEELGSRLWEARFPAPAGRTDPSQLFPDAAGPYITPNLLSSWRFLATSGAYSLSSCAPASFCTQSERGGTWLFLRWLADQEGDGILRQLVQSALTGRANLEAAAGASTAALLGDFAVAVSADSLEGTARTAVDARFQFADRQLRLIYRRLFESYGIAGGITRPFPVAPIELAAGATRTGTMRPGTFATYRLVTPEGRGSVALRFAVPDGSAFTAAAGAQVSLFRVR